MEKQKQINKKLELNKDKYLEIEPIELIEVTDEQINLIKDELNDKDLIEDDDIKELKEKRLKSSSNKIILAHLFVKCHNHLKNNIGKTENKEDEELIKARKEILKYLDDKDNRILRNFIEDYNDNKNFGSYYAGLKIKDIVEENEEVMEKIISIFFKIFEEEE